MKKSLPYLTLLALLGCNGGGSDSSSNVDIVGGDDDINIIFTAYNDEIKLNQSVEILLHETDSSISDINWQLTSAPETATNIQLTSSNTKVIAFTPEMAGEYAFNISFSQNGEDISTSFSISVSGDASPVTARLGHAVLAGNNVSLRAYNSGNNNATYMWNQIDGPTISDITFDADNKQIMFFDAPSVEQDTVFSFEVTSDGETDVVSVLVERADEIAGSAYFDERIARVFAYDAEETLKDALVYCTYSNTLDSSCPLGEVSLISDISTTPTVDDIMSRVVVSHPWMADRFREFLSAYDPNNDFKNLLRATSAIIISYDVRPSFYWAATGAIYLDPSNLWLTPEERDTINEAPDYRSDFGSDLQFVMPWRYVKDNQYAFGSTDVNARESRTMDDIHYRFASLLYHELAHANDFFPSTEWFSHSDTTRILDAALATNFESDDLAAAYPLSSQEMLGLAEVRFRGETASDTQASYQPSDVTSFFTSDDANDFYNYTTTREDYAMLFEELMMQNRFQVLRDVAITSSADDGYIVDWGQRGRINQSNIIPRVRYVTERILPELDVDEAISNLITTEEMISGLDWWDNLDLAPDNSQNSGIQSIRSRVTDKRAVEHRNHHHKALPNQ